MPESLDMSLQRVTLRQQITRLPRCLKRRSAAWWMISPSLEGKALALHETPRVLEQSITAGGKPCANIWKLRISRQQ